MSETAHAGRPLLSIVVPTLNRPAVAVATIESFLSQEYSRLEIIIVDQSDSANERLMSMAEDDPRIHYYHLRPCGSPRARNFGIFRARGEIILSCDDDVRAHPGLLHTLAGCFRAPRIGGVGGRVLTAVDKPLWRVREVGRFNRWTGAVIANFHATFPTEIDHAQGCNFALRTAAVREVGGFDPAFAGNAYWEEADLSCRLRAAGWRMLFEPRAAVEHLQSPAGGNRVLNRRRWTWWHFRNYGLLFLRHGIRPATPLFILYQLARAAGYATREGDAALFPIGVGALYHGLCLAFRERFAAETGTVKRAPSEDEILLAVNARPPLTV